MTRTVKVAVVGSGLAGLTAAYLLSKTQRNEEGVEFEVHLFEKASTLGMDSSSITLADSNWRVDVPMRSFQGGYYPQLIAFYRHLGVDFRQSDFTYSFSRLSQSTSHKRRRITASMIYNGGSGLEGISMPSAMHEEFTQAKDQGALANAVAHAAVLGLFVVVTLQLLACYLRLLLHSLPILRPPRTETLRFGAWAEDTAPRGVLARWLGLDAAWRDFTHSVLVPLFSAVCTTSEEDVLLHPVEEFLDYIWLTLGTHHYVVSNGVRDVVARLTTNIRHIHLAMPISSIQASESDPHQMSIHCATAQETKSHHGFHHIIFATQANRAVPLLESYLESLPIKTRQRQVVEEQIRCLRTFKYMPSIVINHTDDTLMPDDIRDRRDLNLICLDPDEMNSRDTKVADDDISSHCVPPSYTMATHLLAPPSGHPAKLRAVYQTTNPIVAPRKDSILSVARLERAVLTVESKIALQGLYVEKGRRRWQSAGQGVTMLGPLQGAGKLDGSGGPGIWFCGSYAFSGIPLLEGCVASARNVVEQGVLKSEGVEVRTAPW